MSSHHDEGTNKCGTQLTPKRRVTVRSFKGQPLIDIREYYDAEGEMKPGKKGISLNSEQWEQLLALGAQIDGALESLSVAKKTKSAK